MQNPADETNSSGPAAEVCRRRSPLLSSVVPCARIRNIPAVMSNENMDPALPREASEQQEESSFAEILSSFEQQQHADSPGGETVSGTIVSVGPESLLVDIGRKIEGSLKLSRWRETEEGDPQVGAHISVTV